MKPATKTLREAVKMIEGAWVRVYRDGTAWAGIRTLGSPSDPRPVMTALTAAGFKCEMRGKPGTSGADIVDIIL